MLAQQIASESKFGVISRMLTVSVHKEASVNKPAPDMPVQGAAVVHVPGWTM